MKTLTKDEYDLLSGVYNDEPVSGVLWDAMGDLAEAGLLMFMGEDADGYEVFDHTVAGHRAERAHRAFLGKI